MNDRMKAAIWKEYRVFIKQSCVPAVFFFLAAVLTFILMIYKTDKLSPIGGSLIDQYCSNFVFINLLFCDYTILSFSMNVDIQEGTLNPVLVYVKKPSEIWIGQFIFANIVSFLESVVGVISVLIAVKSMLKHSININVLNMVMWILVSFFFGLIFSMLFHFLNWLIVSKYRIILAVSIFVFLFGGYKSLRLLSDNIKNDKSSLIIWTVLYALLTGGILLFFKKVIDSIPKERFAGK